MSKKEDLIKENASNNQEDNPDVNLDTNINTNNNANANANSTKNSVYIEEALKNITTANNLKDQIAKVPLCVEQKNYYDTEIVPLLNTLDVLGRVSYNLGNSTFALSNIRLSRNSKLEDAIKLVYDVNKTSREVYDALKERIEFLIDIGC